MTTRTLTSSLAIAALDGATILLGSLVLATRRRRAAMRLSEIFDAQLRDIGLSRAEVEPRTPFLHRERHELGRW
jgi:uncharacterized protein YjiS (DUF1127 family)